ncbi:MAG: hypothetical protein HBSAPP03_04050 [Phycisphaerae bacterium]|nr:MAG: hypothetical protein HBSAPP03_04050 [Phycisphaerae bacterium]
MSAPRRHARRAFSLLEAIIVVLVLAISVPSTVAWLGESASRRADSVNAVRASTLATTVMETILADASSDAPGLGFAAFASPAAYLDTPTTGLRARLATLTGPSEAIGFAYTVEFSALIDATGAVNADASKNLFRRATVTVTYGSASSATPIVLQVEAMVTDL